MTTITSALEHLKAERKSQIATVFAKYIFEEEKRLSKLNGDVINTQNFISELKSVNLDDTDTVDALLRKLGPAVEMDGTIIDIRNLITSPR